MKKLTAMFTKSKYLFTIIFLYSLKWCNGGHKTTINYLKPCIHPDPPFAKNAQDIVIYNIMTRKDGEKMFVDGNLTIVKNIPLQVKFYSGLLKNGQVHTYHLNFKNMSCKNVITKLVYTSFNVNYDPENCTVFKGFYEFRNLDVNKIEHGASFMPARVMGLKKMYLGLYTSAGTYLCLDIVMQFDIITSRNRNHKTVSIIKID